MQEPGRLLAAVAALSRFSTRATFLALYSTLSTKFVLPLLAFLRKHRSQCERKCFCSACPRSPRLVVCQHACAGTDQTPIISLHDVFKRSEWRILPLVFLFSCKPCCAAPRADSNRVCSRGASRSRRYWRKHERSACMTRTYGRQGTAQHHKRDSFGAIPSGRGLSLKLVFSCS